MVPAVYNRLYPCENLPGVVITGAQACHGAIASQEPVKATLHSRQPLGINASFNGKIIKSSYKGRDFKIFVDIFMTG